MGAGLRFGPLGPATIHLCIDMQRLFGPDGPWCTPWIERVLPVVATIAERAPARTVFTRFIPPLVPENRPGMWRRYFERWKEVTRERLDPTLLDLFPDLGRLVPPATLVDKPTYSAFAYPALPKFVAERGIDTVIVTGAETDICILATVLGAVDRGLRVIVVTDAICSSSDPGHEALTDLYDKRFTEQVETVDAATIMEAWRPT